MLNLNTRESKIELVQEWLAALRGGDYKQGTGALCRVRGTEERYCCLGVLCDVAGLPHRLTGDTSDLMVFKEYVMSEGDSSSAILPESLGEAMVEILTSEYGCTGKLMQMNDNGASFNEIADFIEQHMLKPFRVWRNL